jgi:hypothetical protein
MNKLLRGSVVLVMLASIVGCGAPATRSERGITERTQIIIIAPELVGASVNLNGNRMLVSEDDLTPYQYGVLGATDSDREKSEVVTLSVQPGNNDLKIVLNGTVLFDAKLYLGSGQTREIEL